MKSLNTFEKSLIGINIVLLSVIIGVGIYFYIRFSKENYDWTLIPGSTGMKSLDVNFDTRTIYNASGPGHPTDRALYVTKTTSTADEPIAEFRHSNASQGIGFGFQTIFATGDNTNQKLNIKSKGTETVEINRLSVGGGTGINKINFGATDYLTSGGSNYTIAHGLGVVPIYAHAVAKKDEAYDDVLAVSIKSMDATNIVFSVFRADGSGTSWGSKLYKLLWVAVG